jgi:death-on-curing protein
MNSRFLTLEEVILIHADQISHYGGAAGLRDHGLLDSALAQPKAVFADELLHPTLPSQAAAYLYHIVKNHPFIDGNKRVGTAAALVFLNLNGYELDPTLDEFITGSEQTRLEIVVLEVASGKMGKEELAVFIQNNLVQLL